MTGKVNRSTGEGVVGIGLGSIDPEKACNQKCVKGATHQTVTDTGAGTYSNRQHEKEMREEEVVKTDDSKTQSNFSHHPQHALQPATSSAINSHTASFSNDALYLINVIEFGALFRPVAVAHGGPVLRQPCQHHHHDATLLPHHLPEVRSSVGQRSLGCDVGRIARVMIRLHEAKTLCFGSHRSRPMVCDAVSSWFQTF